MRIHKSRISVLLSCARHYICKNAPNPLRILRICFAVMIIYFFFSWWGMGDGDPKPVPIRFSLSAIYESRSGRIWIMNTTHTRLETLALLCPLPFNITMPSQQNRKQQHRTAAFFYFPFWSVECGVLLWVKSFFFCWDTDYALLLCHAKDWSVSISAIELFTNKESSNARYATGDFFLWTLLPTVLR